MHSHPDIDLFGNSIDKTTFCSFYRRVRETELQNIILKDPNTRVNRMQQLGLSATLATSCRSRSGSVSLLSSIRLIKDNDLLSPKKIGAGRFGTCFVQLFASFTVCVKVFKHDDHYALCNEANVISKFASQHLPYLFGVCVSKQAVVTSFHGFQDYSVTIHCALNGKSKTLPTAIDWKYMLLQIVEGMEQLHVTYHIKSSITI